MITLYSCYFSENHIINMFLLVKIIKPRLGATNNRKNEEIMKFTTTTRESLLKLNVTVGERKIRKRKNNRNKNRVRCDPYMQECENI